MRINSANIHMKRMTATQRNTRQCLQNMTDRANNEPSSSRGNPRLESLIQLQKRDGATAPGSEVVLTGKGLLGGADSAGSSGALQSEQEMRVYTKHQLEEVRMAINTITKTLQNENLTPANREKITKDLLDLKARAKTVQGHLDAYKYREVYSKVRQFR